MVVAAGKGAVPMAQAAAQRLGGRLRAGLVVAPTSAESPHGFELVVGGHPLPSAASEYGGRKALRMAGAVTADELLLVLLSGGASALMAVPAEGITLDAKRATTTQLLRAGADIYALNTVRKHLSSIKGGWLAARCRGRTVGLAVSDVVGDDLSVIASGPTVADASTFADALDVVRRFGGRDAYPPSVIERFARGAAGAIEETPKGGDRRLDRATTTVIGSRRNAMAGAVAEAEALGYHAVRIDDAIAGEARTAATSYMREIAARAASLPRPACVVSSGETTVHVVGRGRGGRNQEFVLAAFPAAPDSFALASVGTDGVDGPTDAAGALADSTTATRAAEAGLGADAFLADNNAYAFFATLGDLIHTGPTGTNVGDLQVILLA